METEIELTLTLAEYEEVSTLLGCGTADLVRLVELADAKGLSVSANNDCECCEGWYLEFRTTYGLDLEEAAGWLRLAPNYREFGEADYGF